MFCAFLFVFVGAMTSRVFYALGKLSLALMQGVSAEVFISNFGHQSYSFKLLSLVEVGWQRWLFLHFFAFVFLSFIGWDTL